MTYEGPIQQFIYEDLHSDLKTIATKYSKLTSKSLYDFLSIDQNMYDLPYDILELLANEVKELTNDHTMSDIDLEGAVKGLLINYDETLLNEDQTSIDFKNKQLSYFRQKSPALKNVINEMSPYIKQALFINETNKQAYSLVLDKNIEITYLPAGRINQIGHSLFVVSQDKTFTWTFDECDFSINDLKDKLNILQIS